MSYRFLISGNSSARSSSSSTSGTNCIDTNSCNMINPSSTLTAARVMDRPSAQEHQAALKCPRCDSTNTKFCYYNNYSLWQPRHFCKACKRYWTRGGMVRNVPVGGACRKKNKRVRKPTATAKASPHDPPPPCSLALPDPLKLLSSMTSSSYNTETSSMLYSSTTLPNAIQVPSCTPAFDLELQASALGAGILSNQRDDDYGLDQFSQQLPLMNDHPQFGSSLSSASEASLLVSSPQRPKEIEANQVLLAHEDLYDLETNEINNCDIEWQIPRDYSLESFGSAATEISPIDSSYLFFKEAAIGWPDAAANRWSSAAHLI